MRHIRERQEAREESLSPYAMRSRLSQGRRRPEPPCPVRTPFQRDRDRIIHCKAFRRLKHKTQVFVAPQGDHYVTRLTHTLEVAQIARTVARALSLNEDLTEAIALGHDLGHTPFGHLGEEMLHELYAPGFHHSQQSLRVVDRLEREGQGLNLTYEVRQGILHHSKSRETIPALGWANGDTFEGQVVKFADLIAYINHDTADAIRAGLFSEEELPAAAVEVLGSSPSQRINTLVCDMVDFSWSVTGLEPGEPPRLGMSPPVRQAAGLLRDFLFDRVYTPPATRTEAEKARKIVRLLFHFFCRHPEQLPSEYQGGEEPRERRVVDYIAGMTDRYAVHIAGEIEPATAGWLPEV